MTDFKKADYDSELAQITNELIILESKEKNLKKSRRKYKNEIKEYQEKIEKETKKLKPVDQTIRDIEVLKDEKNKTQELLQSVQSDKDSSLTEQYDCERTIQDIENKIQNI